jgi:hypothetical protein
LLSPNAQFSSGAGLLGFIPLECRHAGPVCRNDLFGSGGRGAWKTAGEVTSAPTVPPRPRLRGSRGCPPHSFTTSMRVMSRTHI